MKADWASWRKVEKFKSRVQCAPSNSLATQTHINSAYYSKHTRNLHASASHDGFRAPALLAASIVIHTWNNTNMYNPFRAKPNQSEALIGSLSANRVTVSRPFSRCGVDYTGPLLIHEGKHRNARSHKAYILLFVCFATKVIHLELVSTLSPKLYLPLLSDSFCVRVDPHTCVFG